ncbi:hypothetical protein [Ideonella livida]|uniref:Uncharacterized protein n=1 Tax=Ideonella livida TaxID=2707176 RepID=A0A7C9TGM8_9BURK|nr:hypothetical protein [Ideonella livida]NDY89778.1 hypothetical protein [Ideonella livida]
MNDPVFTAQKLGELIQLAREASTSFEKAAVFAAVTALGKEFCSATEDGYAREKASYVVHWLSCALGFEMSNRDCYGDLNAAEGEFESLMMALKRPS